MKLTFFKVLLAGYSSKTSQNIAGFVRAEGRSNDLVPEQAGKIGEDFKTVAKESSTYARYLPVVFISTGRQKHNTRH